MPLPPALLAKLAKRGLIKTDNEDTELAEEQNSKLQEEIIAEDYDDVPQQNESSPKQQPEIFDRFQGWHACPNKWNVYHECSQGCRNHWAQAAEINPSYLKSRMKILQKYPLPSHWLEILEPGLGRYYYWNTDTDMVSWLPPGHPKCQVSRAAAKLRKQMLLDREDRLMEEDTLNDDKGSEYEDSSDDERSISKTRRKSLDLSDSSDYSESDVRERREKSRVERRDRLREDRDKSRNRGKKRGREDALDPMDPAAYSECPRGTWSSGLSQKDEAKTGVDTTAGGPLFQMRPYPNPGSILRANKNVGPNKP